VTRDGVTTTATYDAANQLTGAGGVTYDYDRAGNQTRAGDLAFTYDARGKATRAYRAGEAQTSPLDVRLGYDGRGRRTSRAQGSRYDYWYDATGLTREIEDAGSAQQGYKDASYRYDPYGSPLGAAPTPYNPFRYTGAYFDTSTDLYQMGARYYDEDTGRFTQQDPLLSTVFTRNRYAYTQGNPVNYVDPSGLDAVGMCYGGYAGWGVFGSAQICAGFDTSGNVGISETAGVGGSTPTVGAGPSSMYSNVNQWSDQEGWAASAGVGAGPVSADAWASTSPDGSYRTWGYSVGGRVNVPNVHAQATYTETQSFNVVNAVRSVTDTVTDTVTDWLGSW
jgi:RHS repeat-associated protein